MRVLITGITGFVGSHLAEWALAQGADVVGSIRWRSNTEHIEHLRDRIRLVNSDLRDLSSTRTLIEQARADYIVHLAAQSFVGGSWETPKSRSGSRVSIWSRAPIRWMWGSTSSMVIPTTTIGCCTRFA